MTKLCLFLSSPERQPQGVWAVWNGLAADNGISLEQKLADYLLTIRHEHMVWAYETGKKKIGSKTVADWLEGGVRPSMWWTSLLYERHPRLSPWLYPVYKLRCLEILFENLHIKQLHVIGHDSVLLAVLKLLCRQKGILFTTTGAEEKLKKTPKLQTLYYKIPAPLRAIIRLALWHWRIKRKLPRPAGMQASRSAVTIATYFPNINKVVAREGHFQSHYWERLHELINQHVERGDFICNWLLIHFPAPDISFDECVRLCRRFNLVASGSFTFNYLEQFLDFKSVFRATWRWLKIGCNSLFIEKAFAEACHFQNSDVNFWTYARIQWAESFRGWRCLERCLQNEAFINYTRLSAPQKWTLYVLENCPWERMLTTHCHAVINNGPVVGVQHSTVRPSDFRYFDDYRTFQDERTAEFQPDIICGNGAGAINQWLANKMPESKIFKVEALRYQYLDKLKTAADDGVKPATILILTSFFAEETQNHLRLLAEALNDGCLNPFTLLLKAHPYYSVDWWLNSLSPTQQARIEITSRPLKDLLRPGVIIWASNSTTASLEAAYLRLPLMVMLPYADFDLCPIQEFRGLARTGDLADVKKAIAHPSTPAIPAGYLDINPELSRWQVLLRKMAALDSDNK